jgi:hypothetical protein
VVLVAVAVVVLVAVVAAAMPELAVWTGCFRN